MKSYNADSIQIGLSDIQKIRRVPQMYGYLGNRGFVHAIKEVIQNSIDEGSVVKELKIIVNYNPLTNFVSVEDNARGIPVERILNVFTELHVSGKGAFNDGDAAYGNTAGVHGVGVKFTNAVSGIMSVIVSRDGAIHKLDFIQGESDNNVQVIGKTKKTGTLVRFMPDENILGKITNVKDMVLNMVEDMAYLSTANTVITFNIIDDSMNIQSTSIFKSSNGVLSLLDKYKRTLGVKNHIDVKEFVVHRKSDDMMFKVAYTYSKDVSGANVMSFCNFCSTIKGGTHVDGFTDSIARNIKSFMDKNMNERDKKNINVTLPDSREGLVAVIVTMHKKPVLLGQTKEEVGQEEFIQIAKKLVSENFEIITRDKNDKKYNYTLMEFIKNNVLARVRAKSVKDSYLKEDNEESQFLGSNGKLEPANGDSSYDKELFIVEGDSAMGSAVKYRDSLTQAIFPIRGKIKNTLEDTLDKVLKNEEIKTLVKVLGTNIGPKFDIEKCKYKKIIIMTDADVDGLQIASLLCSFFIKHMPELVKAGYLYKAISPLYSFKINKKTVYVNTYGEYVDYMENLISKDYKVKNGDVLLKGSELKEVLIKNKEYIDVITRTATRLSMTTDVIEDAVIAESMTFEEGKKYIEKKYGFIKLNNVEIDGKQIRVLEGTYDKKYHYVRFDETFDYQFDRAIEIVSNNRFNIEYIVGDKKMSLYNMLKLFESFKPKGMTRYKGLGEMMPKDLAETTMDVNNRSLIRLTYTDLEKTLDQFSVIHGSNQRDLTARKVMMNMFKILKEDIDN